ncbi:putative lipid II flippase FtsW [Desulfuribacillus alkaliarsenatis]|uniref:Probable peptidoglycan glycosyltransferase FtsW n=1 Tax=Desulfuribacillus alkaliarsenatis TaxID=766136 RepID=A0A1E5G1G9_9FIRM|nr:putative lipid II flippase FtsW [Desulfuribacillus alkaliarsenatis]OEF96754.1 cell division protein FtsW [Desulfuribacillus alkaliarsenatis]
MQERKLPDFFLLTITFVLTCFGLVAVYSASFAISFERYHDASYFFTRQLMWAILGFIALLITMNIPYKFLRKLSPLMFFVTLFLLVIVLIPGIGVERNFAQRWIGFGPILIQPSELLKVVISIYFAHYLSKRLDRMDEFKETVQPILIMLAICFGLIMLQPDFSTAVIIAIITFTLLFSAGARIKHLFLVGVAMLPLVIIMAIWKPYRIKRLMTFLDPWAADSLKEGYQIIHSLYAFGNGGISGVGFGAGLQKLFYLPEPHTDFIFSIIGEELGLIGAISIILLFALFLWRGLLISSKVEDPFGSLLALSLTVMISVQAFMNIAITIGMLPVTGLTLPFISYGGSSLLVTLIATGIILNISRDVSK